jgi:hypothetical protein
VNIWNAAPSNGPLAFANDAQNLYYPSAGGDIRELSKTGAQNNFAAQGQGASGGIVVDSQSVYYTGLDGVDSVPLGSTGTTPVTIASGGGSISNPLAVAVDPSNVYLVDDQGRVWSSPIVVGPSSLVSTAAPPLHPSIAVNSTGVYWTASVLEEAPLTGGTATPFGQGDKSYDAVLATASNVYWVSDSGLHVAAANGSNPSSLSTSGTTNQSAIALGASYAFWTASGALYRVPLAGGTTDQLATQVTDGVVTVDSTSVYYYTTSGNIVKLTPTQAP